MNYVTEAWNRLVRLVRPDVDAIIAAFLKTQTKLEAYIAREETKLAAEARAIEAMLAQKALRNSTINRAYRLVHRFTELTA